MREIIYVQAGTTANYVGTHFWNSQDYYATLDVDGDEHERIDHAKSFSVREDVETRSNTLRPRLLLFERKGNLGGLMRAQALATDQDAGSRSQPLWDAPVEEHKEEAIPPSEYLTQLENDPVEEIEPPTAVQYWSDFNHSYFSSHSLHVLPGLPDSGKGESILGWAQSKDEFSRIFAEKGIDENDLRYFAEECDYLQGFQMSFDVNNYGGFISSFHDLLQDEYPKTDTLNFAFLAMNAYPRTYNPKTTPLLLNDALSLHSLSLLDGHSVPLLHRQSWPQGSWSQHLDLHDTMFHTSAVYAAHVESITYPLRQLGGQDTIRSIFSSSDANMYELSGILPIWSKRDIDVSSILDFVTPDHLVFERRVHSRLFVRGVARGCHRDLLEQLKETFYLSDSTLSDYSRHYPLPLSHPQFFRPNPPLPNAHPARVMSVPTVTLLSQTNSLASLLDKYVRGCREVVRRGPDLADGRYGVDRDELGQVVEDLFNARDAYGYIDHDQAEECELDI